MKRRCMALLAAGMLALLTAGCGQAGAGGTLTVGVRDDIINFGYLNEKTGKYYGLEIDIAQEMAERMGYGEVEFVTVTPDNRKEMLLDGKVDCLIATYTISDTRLENFDFSPAYYQDNMQVVVEKSSMVNDISELKGLNIGTMSGANAAPLLAIKLNEHAGIRRDRRGLHGPLYRRNVYERRPEISGHRDHRAGIRCGHTKRIQVVKRSEKHHSGNAG